MKNTLRYSVLRYSPSKIAGETINLGIIYADEQNDVREFKHTQKLARIKKFDDEISLDVVKDLLKGIQFDINNSLLNRSFSLDEYIKFYINNFFFDEPKLIYYENWEATVERINKLYFRFDYEKKDRPSKDDDIKFLGEVLRETTPSVKRNIKIKGRFDETICYDFVSEKLKVKIFDFDGKDLNKLINTAKSWALNCMTDPDQNACIIYRYSDSADLSQKKCFEEIGKIFDYAHANFLNIDEGIQYIQKSQVTS